MIITMHLFKRSSIDSFTDAAGDMIAAENTVVNSFAGELT